MLGDSSELSIEKAELDLDVVDDRCVHGKTLRRIPTRSSSNAKIERTFSEPPEPTFTSLLVVESSGSLNVSSTADGSSMPLRVDSISVSESVSTLIAEVGSDSCSASETNVTSGVGSGAGSDAGPTLNSILVRLSAPSISRWAAITVTSNNVLRVIALASS